MEMANARKLSRVITNSQQSACLQTQLQSRTLTSLLCFDAQAQQNSMQVAKKTSAVVVLVQQIFYVERDLFAGVNLCKLIAVALEGRRFVENL